MGRYDHLKSKKKHPKSKVKVVQEIFILLAVIITISVIIVRLVMHFKK